MNIERVKHNDKFFIINNESFHYAVSEVVQKAGVEAKKIMHYNWVMPMYVKAIKDNFDGVESFELCPVDVNTLTTHTSGWSWSNEFEYAEIGKTIFKTEEEAWELYNSKYSDEDKEVYKELRRLRFLQEGKATSI